MWLRANIRITCLKSTLFLGLVSLVDDQGLTGQTSLRCLRSGHSHEDLDQVFGVLATHLVRKGSQAMEPADFVSLIQKWMDESLVRPFETGRYCVHLDQCRDWCYGCIHGLGLFFCDSVTITSWVMEFEKPV